MRLFSFVSLGLLKSRQVGFVDKLSQIVVRESSDPNYISSDEELDDDVDTHFMMSVKRLVASKDPLDKNFVHIYQLFNHIKTRDKTSLAFKNHIKKARISNDMSQFFSKNESQLDSSLEAIAHDTINKYKSKKKGQGGEDKRQSQGKAEAVIKHRFGDMLGLKRSGTYDERTLLNRDITLKDTSSFLVNKEISSKETISQIKDNST